MVNLHCHICGECCGEMRGASLIVYSSHDNDHSPEIDLKDILAAARKTDAGLMIMREKYDEGILEFVTR